jgi:glycosidase
MISDCDAGSPYAVTEYVCNPNLGTDSDLLALKQQLNAMGLKLMLDFVPNHSAVDSPWTTAHIDW